MWATHLVSPGCQLWEQRGPGPARREPGSPALNPGPSGFEPLGPCHHQRAAAGAAGHQGGPPIAKAHPTVHFRLLSPAPNSPPPFNLRRKAGRESLREGNAFRPGSCGTASRAGSPPPPLRPSSGPGRETVWGPGLCQAPSALRSHPSVRPRSRAQRCVAPGTVSVWRPDLRALRLTSPVARISALSHPQGAYWVSLVSSTRTCIGFKLSGIPETFKGARR